MKKFLVLCIGIVSVFGIHTVKADTNTYVYDTSIDNNSFYDDYYFSSEYSYSFINEEVDNLVAIWEKRFKSDYPYYSIHLYHGDLSFYIQLIMYNAIPLNYSSFLNLSIEKPTMYSFNYRFENGNKLDCISGNSCFDDIYQVSRPTNFQMRDIFLKTASSLYLPYLYYDSNFDLVYDLEDSIIVNDLNGNNLFTLSQNGIIPKSKNLFFNEVDNKYVEINLNNYAYVALSLKDYTKEISNSYSEYSNIYVKGQLCATPVYNYGQTERKDILTGSKVQACSLYNSDYALTRFYILPSDIKNHAIYYLKAYDTTKDNYVKIDTSYFDITYITEENKDNPQVSIDGKIYPTLSYDKLTDTSTKSEDEGYVSGVSCAVGDFNCYNEYNPSNVFKDIFDKPLEALKSVWSAIINVFELIKMFIMLLPQTLQSFLYLSFMIAIVLGIIKIIL